MALIHFAVTLFVSAFLLFLVQPMVGKMILPKLGGTPQVWNTCMMFFQMVLLAGYAYTHTVTSKMPVKKQLITHCFMLLLPLLVLILPVVLGYGRPFPVATFGAEGGGNPIFATLGLLCVIVGIPFLVVSTTAPLLQRWFHNTGHPAAKDPYFLYGASNLGSILGLLLYPACVEYLLGLNDQAWFWLWGYLVLFAMVGGCALMVFKSPPLVTLPGGEDEANLEPAPRRCRCRPLRRPPRSPRRHRPQPPRARPAFAAEASAAVAAAACRHRLARPKGRRPSTSRKHCPNRSRTTNLMKSRPCAGCAGLAWPRCLPA